MIPLASETINQVAATAPRQHKASWMTILCFFSFRLPWIMRASGGGALAPITCKRYGRAFLSFVYR